MEVVAEWRQPSTAAAYKRPIFWHALLLLHLHSCMGIYVQAAINGASIQEFLPPATLAAVPGVQADTTTNIDRSMPTENRWNTMIAPLVNISLSGVVYFQVIPTSLMVQLFRSTW